MPSVKGVGCSLVVSGHPAEEYGAIVEDNFVSTYVIATAHEDFRIGVVTTELVHENLEIYVYIDGKYQNSSTFTGLTPDHPVGEEYHGKRERNRGDLEVFFERSWRFVDLIEGQPRSPSTTYTLMFSADSDGGNDGWGFYKEGKAR